MIPILFNKDEKTFTSLGLGQMDATLVEVERERNGNYTLYAEVPFNSPQAKHLTKEMLIKADAGARTKWQTFKINRTIKDTNADVIKVYADHISMDTINDAMKPKVAIRQQTAEGALRQWANSLVSGKAYDVQSDITHIGSTDWTIDEVENARQALGGVSGSILDVWGGEYEFDNNTIILHKEMGRTAPTVLEYGRNIVSLEYEELIDGVYTSIYPYATYTPKSEDNKQLPDVMVTLDELIVDSEYAGNYETRRIQIVDFSNEFDSNAENPEIPTQAKLRTLAKAYVKNNGYGIPKISQEIDFVDLSKTLDYQDIQVMEEIELNDRVPVYYPNIDAETNDVKVTTTNWDVLNNRYSKITLSTIGAMNSNSITSKLNTAIKDLKAEQKKINNTVPYLINGQGNRVWHTTPDENMEHKIDDTWFKKNGKYTIIYRWNGSMWEEVLNDETFITEIEAGVSTAIEEVEKAVQSAQEADARASEAIEKAGANASLLSTHQNTLDTIKNTTIPNVNKVASDAMAEAKSALSSASSAMDEAKKADGKISDYVTKNGLVNGTTVDSKIDTATGEINKKITSVESDIKNLDNTNLFSYLNKNIVNEGGGGALAFRSDTPYGFYSTGASDDSDDIRMYDVLDGNGFYTISFDIKGTQNGGAFLSLQVNKKGINPASASTPYTVRTPSNNEYGHASVTIEVTDFKGDGTDYISFNPSWAYVYLRNIKVQKGKYDTGFTPALADQYTQHDFQIFESTYNEDVKGINSSLTELSNKKLDGSTYTDFYTNEYKKTAQGVTDTYAKVNKIIDANGNSTDTFAKAVYDRNATRQTASFNEVTKNLVTTTTYSEGVKGINQSITTLRGDLDNLSVGGRNLLQKTYSEWKTLTMSEGVWFTSFGYNDNYKVEVGQTYTFSIIVDKVNPDDTVPINLHLGLGNDRGLYNYDIVEWRQNSMPMGKKVSLTYTITESDVNNGARPWFAYRLRNERIATHIKYKEAKLEKGTVATDWTPAPEDMLGQADFTIFKNTYEKNDETIKSRLTAIDSSAEGSVVTRLNKAESTASGNSQLIATINSNYVKQSNIDASILADKKIKDTRSTNQLPSWYFSNYPAQEVREFKQVSTMGVGSGSYGILTTNVPWTGSSGGTVKQKFETNTETHVRQSNSAGTAWGAWSKQVDTSDTTYQKITQTSSLYERVIGSTEANVKSNMARIVMTDKSFQTEIVDKQDLKTAMASGTSMTSDPYFAKGANGISVYDNANTGTLSITRQSTSGTSIPAPVNKPHRIAIAHKASSATTPNRGGIVNTKMSWANGTVIVKFTAYLPVGRSFAYANNGLGNGYTAGWLTDNKGTGKWETYMYYYRFGSTGSFSSFGHLSVTGSSSAFTWYLSEYDIINVNETSASKITQLADNINLKVSKGDISNQININPQGVVIKGNKIALSGDTTVDGTFWTKQVNAIKVNASNITTGTLNASKVKVINLDASRITGNLTEFIKTNWNQATGGGVTITGSGVRAINSEGSRVTLENGVVSVGNRSGVNLGFFGDHVLNKSATGTMTITASYGTETAFISATNTDGKTYKRSMSIMAGAGEIDMFTTLDMNKNSLKDVTNIGFTGGLIKGNISGSARYMTIDAGTGTAFDIAGVTRMSITSVVNIFSGIDMRGKDIASVGKLSYNSDQRLKTNIKDTNIRALDAIRNWQLVSYDWLESGEHVEIGLIAQNSPEVMTYNEENDIYGIDAGKQTMINTLAIQQLDSKTNDEISKLKAQIASLQDELALLKGD